MRLWGMKKRGGVPLRSGRVDPELDLGARLHNEHFYLLKRALLSAHQSRGSK